MVTLSRQASFLLACALSTVAVVVLAVAMPATAAPMSGTYHGLMPARILDTRVGIGVVAGAVASGHEAVLTLAGLK